MTRIDQSAFQIGALELLAGGVPRPEIASRGQSGSSGDWLKTSEMFGFTQRDTRL